MKRKTIVLLSSIMAGALVVGGAFAATYAVTDNADPFGVNITGGDLDEDKTDYVTLEWGSTTDLKGVGNLIVGEPRKAGIVSLKSSENYSGVFTLSIEDRTVKAKETTAADLIDYLNVYVYEGALTLKPDGSLPDGTIAMSIAKATSKDTQGHKNAAINNALGTSAGHEYTVFVELDSSATSVYTQLKDDIVYLQVDWNAQSGDEITENVVYTSKPNDWEDIYLYAWAGAKVNAEWPGVKMVNVYENVYRLPMPLGMEKVIFNDGGSNQTDDILLTGYAPGTPYYDFSSKTWKAVPAKTEVNVSVKVNGVAAEYEDITAQTGGNDLGVYRVSLKVNDVVTFKDGETDIDFYHYDETQQKVVKDGASYTATVEGDHTFYYNTDKQMFGFAPAATKTYYLVGTINGWELTNPLSATDDANKFTTEYTFAAGDKIKVNDGDNAWFNNASVYDGCGYTITDDNDHNVQVTEAGTYTVNFYVVSEYNNHIELIKK